MKDGIDFTDPLIIVFMLIEIITEIGLALFKNLFFQLLN